MRPNPSQRVVAVLPAQGWRVSYRNPDGSTFTHPLLGWLVWDDGSVEPIDTDPYGVVEPVTETANFERLIEPHTETSEPTTTGRNEAT